MVSDGTHLWTASRDKPQGMAAQRLGFCPKITHREGGSTRSINALACHTATIIDLAVRRRRPHGPAFHLLTDPIHWVDPVLLKPSICF